MVTNTNGCDSEEVKKKVETKCKTDLGPEFRDTTQYNDTHPIALAVTVRLGGDAPCDDAVSLSDRLLRIDRPVVRHIYNQSMAN